MSDWVHVADLADLARRKKKLVTAGATSIALFLDGGEVFAFQDSCIHKGRPLSRGTLLHGRVVCPGHQWAFDLRTGQADDRPECQPGFPVRVEEDGRIWVCPEPAAPGATAPTASAPAATASASAPPERAATTAVPAAARPAQPAPPVQE
jgi:nitrite reductase (NADH) small subunit